MSYSAIGFIPFIDLFDKNKPINIQKGEALIESLKEFSKEVVNSASDLINQITESIKDHLDGEEIPDTESLSDSEDSESSEDSEDASEEAHQPVEMVEIWADSALENFSFDNVQPNWLVPHRSLADMQASYNQQILQSKTFLLEWIRMTPDRRDQKRVQSRQNRRKAYQPIIASYGRYDDVRNIWYLIEARDTLDRHQRNQNQFDIWSNKTPEERRQLDVRNEGIEDQIILSSQDEIWDDVQTIKVQDEQYFADHFMRESIDWWISLTVDMRRDKRRVNTGIKDYIHQQGYDLKEEWLQVINRIEEEDRNIKVKDEQYFVDNFMRESIDWWRSLTVDMRRDKRRLNTGIKDYIHQEGYDLKEEWLEIINRIEEEDREVLEARRTRRREESRNRRRRQRSITREGRERAGEQKNREIVSITGQADHIAGRIANRIIEERRQRYARIAEELQVKSRQWNERVEARHERELARLENVSENRRTRIRQEVLIYEFSLLSIEEQRQVSDIYDYSENYNNLTPFSRLFNWRSSRFLGRELKPIVRAISNKARAITDRNKLEVCARGGDDLDRSSCCGYIKFGKIHEYGSLFKSYCYGDELSSDVETFVTEQESFIRNSLCQLSIEACIDWSQWGSKSFAERERQRIEDPYIDISNVPEELRDSVFALEESDNYTREQLAGEHISIMENMTAQERFERQKDGENIREQIDVSQLSDDLKMQIDRIDEEVYIIRNQLARTELDKRQAMSYEERMALNYSMGDLFDVSSLSSDVRREIISLETHDAERAENLRRAIERAAESARRARLEAARRAMGDPSVTGYYRAKVKLFPIRCYNNNNPAYPYTEDSDMQLSLTDWDEQLRLKIHNDISDEVVRLAANVRAVRMFINTPSNTYYETNYIEYESEGEVETYLLNNLMDIYNTENNSYIKVIPQDDSHSAQVRWGSMGRRVNRRFRGSFRIEITDRRNPIDHPTEWSLINDLPIEWYIRSVIISELESDDTIEAFKAQAVAARSYFFNMALDEDVQERGWDIDPTQCNQVYTGVRENNRAEQAVAETTGLVLTYNDLVAKTQYYACGRSSTKRGLNPLERPRNIPGNITCSGYRRRLIDNHGLGMPQFAANYLTIYGWATSNSNRPTEGAKVPENIHQPWTWLDVLNYFYRGENSRVEIKDFRKLQSINLTH